MNNLTKRMLTSFVLLFTIYISFKSSWFLLFLLLVIAYLALIEFNEIFKKINKIFLFNYFLSILISVIYIFIFTTTIWIYLTPFEFEKSLQIIFLLLISVSTDIGGFVFGKIIGGKKFTKISPNKTYSGIIGSFIFSFISGYLFINFYSDYLSFKINIFILIFLISLISQLGDLFISYLKRKAKVKDTGLTLPGHGGILDRIDGIILALPFGAVLISF